MNPWLVCTGCAEFRVVTYLAVCRPSTDVVGENNAMKVTGMSMALMSLVFLFYEKSQKCKHKYILNVFNNI